MKTKQIFAGISAAAVLAMVTPAYAGGLLGGGAGAAGALGGSMTSGIGGMTGQGAFDGRGAAGTSFDRFPERQASRATKPATSGAESAQRSGGTAKAVSGSAAHQADGSAFTALGQASGQSSSATNAATDKSGWLGIVNQMVATGAKVKKGDIPAVVNYLARNFGIPGAVNPNKATAEEIESGLHLTSKEAEAIVQYRKQHGDFKDWHGLLKVEGVDNKKIIEAKDRIAL